MTGPYTGRYPAIDRLLARKQAISKLRSLKKVSGSPSHSSDVFDACYHARQPLAADEFAATAVAELSEPADSAICAAKFASSENTTDSVHHLGCHYSQSKQHIASQVAHRQYFHIKAWRQQRHDAAVIVQKYVRCFLAKQLVLQLRCIRKHAGQRRQHMLITCVQLWRRHVCSFTKFR